VSSATIAFSRLDRDNTTRRSSYSSSCVHLLNLLPFFLLVVAFTDMCFFFSSAPLSADEANGKYGSALGQFGGNQENFDISLCQTPCREPLCWCCSMMCLCPAQIYLRHRVLNHVEPGSGWSNYECCQGYFGGCCCLQPGRMGDKTCPVPCMCLEACLCPGLAASASGMVIRQRYGLGLDEDDVRLIRCSNCLQIFSCLCTIIACITPCEEDDALARIIDCIADVVFCCVAGCMTAQANHEVKKREAEAPQGQRMER